MIIAGIHVGTPEEESKKYQKDFPELKKANICRIIDSLIVDKLRQFANNMKG